MHALLVPLRDEHGRVLPGVAIEDCGPKLGLDGVDNGRIAFDQRPRAARRAARPLRAGARGRHVLQPDREPDQALLRHARDAHPGPREHLRRVDHRLQGRARPSRSATPSPGASSARPAATRCCCMDYRTHQRRLLPALATTYGLHFAQERLVARLHEVFTAEDVPDRKRRELETMAAGLKAVASWHATDDDPGLPRGVRRRRLPARQPLRRAEGRHRRLHHVRGRQHGPAPARREEPADRLPGPVRRARPARRRVVLRRPGDRHRSPSARRCARCWAGWPPTSSPAATRGRSR